MVRFLVLYNTPIDIEAFERHYHEVHIPLGKKLSGLKRYTLSRNIAPIRGGDAYYMVAELDWDSTEALKQAFQSPEGQATAADIENLEKLSPGIHSMIYELEDF
ncbi:Ethyl tert-butyl ether degradation EthD [candidate division TM7 genomosp. GTL1]|nr:Ethyl tert-butyl ether degradation EthD [candidate division TM7 genomosp. GTL1]